MGIFCVLLNSDFPGIHVCVYRTRYKMDGVYGWNTLKNG